MITWLIWTIWTSLSTVPRQAVKFNHSLTRMICKFLNMGPPKYVINWTYIYVMRLLKYAVSCRHKLTSWSIPNMPSVVTLILSDSLNKPSIVGLRCVYMWCDLLLDTSVYMVGRGPVLQTLVLCNNFRFKIKSMWGDTEASSSCASAMNIRDFI